MVVQEANLAFLERTAALLPYFSKVGIGCDVLVYSQDEVQRLRAENNPFLRRAFSEGLRLVCRGETLPVESPATGR